MKEPSDQDTKFKKKILDIITPRLGSNKFRYCINRTQYSYMTGEIFAASEEAARERISGFKDSIPPELFDHAGTSEIVKINEIKEKNGSI